MNVYDDLPDDDQQAFMYLEDKFQKEFERAHERAHERERNNKDQDSMLEYCAAQYMNKTIAAAKALVIHPINEYAVYSHNNPEFLSIYIEFKADVDNIIVQMQIHTSRRKKSLSVGLSVEQKTDILALVEKIRKSIDKSSANQAKKDKIFTIITSLSLEISKDRTRLERFGDLARELAGISRDVEDIGAEPWWKWFKAVMGVVDDAKDSELQLPKPLEIKCIEPPKKQLPKPSANNGT